MPKESSIIPKRIPGNQYFDMKVKMMQEQEEQANLDEFGPDVSKISINFDKIKFLYSKF